MKLNGKTKLWIALGNQEEGKNGEIVTERNKEDIKKLSSYCILRKNINYIKQIEMWCF